MALNHTTLGSKNSKTHWNRSKTLLQGKTEKVVMAVADDRYISVYYLYRDGDSAAIETAHQNAFRGHSELTWDPPFFEVGSEPSPSV